MVTPVVTSSGRSRSSGGGSSTSRSHSHSQHGDKHDRRRRDKDKERVEKERVRKEHARKVLEEQKINKARRKWQKQSEFLCSIKFRNNLPDPPLGPHFLEVPLDLSKYVAYKPTTLDTDYKWKLHYERDLGVPIDIIDSKNYLLPKNPVPLPKEDEALLNWREDDNSSTVGKEALSTSARRRAVDTSVTWLKRTVYLTNDPFDPVHQFKSEQQAQADKRMELEKEIARGGQQDRKQLIEESFMHANSRKPLVHSDEKKKHLTVESVMPVFPDVSLWSNTYTTVAFDKDPAVDDSVKGSETRKRKRANEALLCNVKRTTFEGSSHEIITGSYLMPKDNKGDEEEQQDDDEEGDKYEFVKDYKFNIITYQEKKQFDVNPHMLFVINPDTGEVTYSKLSAKVELSNLPREQGQPLTGRGARVSRRGLSEEEITNARAKVSTDLQIEGDYTMGGMLGEMDDGYTEEQGNGVEQEGMEEEGEEIQENGYVHGQDDGVNRHANHHGNESSRTWTSGASDVERESVLSMMSNAAVKGTESSEGDILGANTDDNDSGT